jgi:YHS domain-containing protein
MKKVFVLCIGLAAIVACNNAATEEKASKDTSSHSMPTVEQIGIDTTGLKFASKDDPTCGMPITAGISDTATVDGKLYGFCAKECKDEFLKTASAKK